MTGTMAAPCSCSNTRLGRARTSVTSSSTWRPSSTPLTRLTVSGSVSIPAICSPQGTTSPRRAGTRRRFEQFDATVGLARLQVLHLNDSKYPCGSRRDRHDHIGRGWVGLKAFRRLLEDPRLRGAPDDSGNAEVAPRPGRGRRTRSRRRTESPDAALASGHLSRLSAVRRSALTLSANTSGVELEDARAGLPGVATQPGLHTRLREKRLSIPSPLGRQPVAATSRDASPPRRTRP